MGYYSRGHDEIDLTPPLPWSAIKGSKFLKDSGEYTDLMVEVAVEARDTDQGVFSVISGVSITWRCVDEMRARQVETELSELAKLALKHGSVPSGYLTRVGEAQGDIERYRLAPLTSSGYATEKVQLRWPDGSECSDYY